MRFDKGNHQERRYLPNSSRWLYRLQSINHPQQSQIRIKKLLLFLLSKSPLSGEMAADEYTDDRPVQFDAFLKNVRVCKLLFGLCLPICFSLEFAHLVLNFQGMTDGLTVKERWVSIMVTLTDLAGLSLIVSPSPKPNND